MFARVWLRSLVVRRGRAVTAILAVTVAAAVASALLNLYVDIQSKLRQEFRSYGANIVVVSRNGAALPQKALATVEDTLGGRGIAVPFAYAVARTKTGAPVVVAGTEMVKVRRLNPWWQVSAWPTSEGAALVGVRAVGLLSPGQSFALTFAGRTREFVPAGTVRTGAADDSRIFLHLSDFIAWTGVQPSLIEIRAAGSHQEIGNVIQRLAGALPDAEVKPVRQIIEAESRVFDKTRMTVLATTAIVILTATLCVLATLTTWVLDRQKEFAVMKALGASERLIKWIFAVEGAALGLGGAVLGYLIGIGAAAWIGRANFDAPVTPRLSVLPIIVLGSVAVALMAAIVPLSLVRRAQPAAVLRGE